MPHIFFERLEKRQSTQSIVPSFGGLTAIAIYSVQVPGGTFPGSIGYTPQSPGYGYLLYGVQPPNPFSPSYPTGGYYPWWGGSLFGGTGYNPWINPINRYNPWGSWNSWGLGNIFSPIWNLFGGLFGGSYPGWNNYPTYPDIRLLYGINPNPQPVYGVSISPTPPTNIIAYYGVSVPEYGIGIPY